MMDKADLERQARALQRKQETLIEALALMLISATAGLGAAALAIALLE